MLFHLSWIPSLIPMLLLVKAFTCFSTGKGITSLLYWEIFPTTDNAFKEWMTLFSCQEKMKQSCSIYLIFDTCVFFFIFVVVFFSWHVQYVNRSYKYLIFHLFNKRHAKHKTAKFLQGSEILGVLKFRAAAAAGTCIMRVLSTPAGLWIPPGPIILVCLFFLTTSSV